MSRSDQERLVDIGEAIASIHGHMASLKGGDDEETELLHDAVLFQFVVIGEAVKHLSPETRAMAPEIPWSDIAGLRDLIAHEYFRIDMDLILRTADQDLPALEAAIRRIAE